MSGAGRENLVFAADPEEQRHLAFCVFIDTLNPWRPNLQKKKKHAKKPEISTSAII